MQNSNFYLLLSNDQNYEIKIHFDIPMTIKWLTRKYKQDEKDNSLL